MSYREATTGFSLVFAVFFGTVSACAADKKEARRPLRVLLLASGPTREYQFLRTLLVRERDARHIELSIHLQPPPGRKESRSGQVQDVPAERLLASFPARLESFETIIAFDPDWSRIATDSFAALKKWAEAKGHTLILIAGPIHTAQLARASNAVKLKPILDLYPVVLTDIRTSPREIDTSKPRRLHFPSGAGQRPFLKLDEKGADALAGWEEFFTGRKTAEAKGEAELRHGFYSYYPVRGVKAGGVVLAALADPKAKLKDGKEQPFLVTMPVGDGRVIFLSSGEMWRLRQHRAAYHEHFWMGLLAHAGNVSGASPEPAVPTKPEEMSAANLKLEVQALQTLYQFQFSAEQMQNLAKIAPQTAQPDRPRKPGQVSDEYRQLLLDLRNALIDANDEENIDGLQDKLDELTESEKPSLDDDIEVTAAARQRAPMVLRRLKPAQLAHYLGSVEDEIVDPRERLRTSLEKVRELKPDEWKAKRDEIAEEVGWLVAGLNADRSGRVSDRVVALLSETRGLSADDFKKRQAELERSIEQIVGDLGPATVLEHTVEHALVELLSNPRLAAALKGRLP